MAKKTANPTDEDLEQERFVVRGDPEDALRRLLDAPPSSNEADSDSPEDA